MSKEIFGLGFGIMQEDSLHTMTLQSMIPSASSTTFTFGLSCNCSVTFSVVSVFDLEISHKDIQVLDVQVQSLVQVKFALDHKCNTFIHRVFWLGNRLHGGVSLDSLDWCVCDTIEGALKGDSYCVCTCDGLIEGAFDVDDITLEVLKSCVTHCTLCVHMFDSALCVEVAVSCTVCPFILGLSSSTVQSKSLHGIFHLPIQVVHSLHHHTLWLKMFMVPNVHVLVQLQLSLYGIATVMLMLMLDMMFLEFGVVMVTAMHILFLLVLFTGQPIWIVKRLH